MRLSLVIVTWNEREDVLRCVRAAIANPAQYGQEIIVVDNGSAAGTATALHGTPGVRVIRSETNGGPTVGRNIGMRAAKGRYIAMLDSDAWVTAGALDRMCAALDTDPSIGLVGPRLVDEDGRLLFSCQRIPSPLAVVGNRVSALRGPARRATARHLMYDVDHRVAQDVEYVLGVAMIFRRQQVAAIGGFDERFGVSTSGDYGFDDADWALRVRRHGLRVVYLPSARVVHRYRRRRTRSPISNANAALAASYLLVRAKHAGRTPQLAEPFRRLGRTAVVRPPDEPR